MKKTDLHQYQHDASRFILNNTRSMLAVDMGMGKTIATLSAIAELFSHALIYGVLILAPRRVAESVWKQQCAEWEHTAHMRVCVLRGNKKVMERNLEVPHHVWVTNYESLPWLYSTLNKNFFRRGRSLPFDMIVFDESTRIKNTEGKRISTWYRHNSLGYSMLDYFPRRIGMTGTIAPNGYWDLLGQYLALDDGARLGASQRIYEEMFFEVNPYTRRRALRSGAKEEIQKLIADITFSLQADQYLDLPDYVYNNLYVDLPPAARAAYDSLESDMFAELASGTVEVFNASAVTTKCRQVANGVVLDSGDDRTAHVVHDAKLEALDEVLEEAAGQPVFVVYNYVADMERIKSRYKGTYRIGYLGPGVSESKAVDLIDDWNRGLYDILLSHPKSSGHGLNLQHGSHQLVWFGVDYNLEDYQQTNARLRRQGQKNPCVIVHHILARNTVDSVILSALASKARDQQELRDKLEEYMLAKQQKAA